jgi:guanine deaminase
VLTPLEDGGLELIDDGVVAVDDHGRIEAVWPWRRARKELRCPIHDLRPHVLVPGFVDAHLHYPQTEIIGRATGPLLEWLKTSVFPEEARFRQARYAHRVAARFIDRMLEQGTTTAAVFSSSDARATSILFRHLADRGMRAIVGLTLMDTRCPKELRVPRVDAMRAARELVKRWHGFDRGRLRFAITPRFALSCTRGLLRDAGKLAEEMALPIQTHIGETIREGAETLRVHGYASSYLDVYDRAGLVTDRTILAHAIHLSAAEWRRVRACGAHIAHCPDSNFFLGSGRMPLSRPRTLGINVGLGTDVAAGRTFSIRRIMGSAYDNAMCLERPAGLGELFTMATLGGARALGCSDVTGSLEPGKEADIVALRCSSSARTPEELLQSIIFDADDPTVVASWVRGKRLPR